MGSRDFESVHLDFKVGGNTNHARLHCSTFCSFIIDISSYHFAWIQDISKATILLVVGFQASLVEVRPFSYAL